MSPAPYSAPVAAIDLGSNTVRLLVATALGDGIHRHVQRQVATRLGQNLQPGAPLLHEAVERTFSVLEEYRDLIDRAGAAHTLVGATMAVREAADGTDFLDRIASAFGFDTVVLSGRMEAGLTAAGVMTALDPTPEAAVIFDLGGRSTEFIFIRDPETAWSCSLSLGAVALTEAHLHSDPPTPDQLSACRAAIAARLSAGLAGRPGSGEAPALIGTAGTVTTLAAMAQGMTVYRREGIDNFRLNRNALVALYDKMIAVPTAGRASFPGLPADRADIIPAGAAVVMEIMDFFKINPMIVSDAGLLEGIWLAAAGRRSIPDD